MNSPDKGSSAAGLKAVSDEELLRVLRQSNKLRNPRRLRRAITSTGKPGAPEWTLQDQALLGKMPDAEAAKRLGRTIVVIRIRRQRLNVPNYGHPAGRFKRWTSEELALLCTMPDRLLARKLHRTRIAVTARRDQLRIPNPPFVWWTPEEDKVLGTAPDAEIAGRLGRSIKSVKGRRLLLGIKFPNPRRPWPSEDLALLGTLSDAVLANQFNRPESVVRSKRLQLGQREPSESASGCNIHGEISDK